MFNFNNIVKMVNGITNPKQAIEFMLNKMPQEQANLLRATMNSKQPEQALIDFANQGKISIDQLKTAKGYYTTARKFGLKANIPNEVWNKAEEILSRNKSKYF